MSLKLTTRQIANVLQSPFKNVDKNWPILQVELIQHFIKYDSGLIAALATIGVECREFKPIHEYGTNAYFKYMYDIESQSAERRKVAMQLGNINPGDGIKFHGRGYIQLTGRNNYRSFSAVCNAPLEVDPDMVLLPSLASTAFAWYFRNHGIDAWAQRAYTSTLKQCKYCKLNTRPTIKEEFCSTCGWKMVRRLVNGGLNGWSAFKIYIDKFIQLVR